MLLTRPVALAVALLPFCLTPGCISEVEGTWIVTANTYESMEQSHGGTLAITGTRGCTAHVEESVWYGPYDGWLQIEHRFSCELDRHGRGEWRIDPTDGSPVWDCLVNRDEMYCEADLEEYWLER